MDGRCEDSRLTVKETVTARGTVACTRNTMRVRRMIKCGSTASYSTALVMSSTTFLASPKTIMVLSM